MSNATKKYLLENPPIEKTDDSQADLSDTNRYELIPAYQRPTTPRHDLTVGRSDIDTKANTKLTAGTVVGYILVAVITLTGRVHVSFKRNFILSVIS